MAPPDPARPGAPLLSVVMPAHNEAGLVEQTLADLLVAFRSRELAFELVVVENGSTDGTAEVAGSVAALDPEVQVRRLATADYGAAMRDGILAARGEVVVVFDVDYYDPEFVDLVLPDLTRDDGPTIVVGSKRAAGTHDTRPWPRRMITAGFALVLRAGFGLRVSDTHGMKGMRASPIRPIVHECRFGTDLFDTELVLRAERAGLVIAEVPVTVEERRPSRTPIARRVVRTLFGLVRLRVALWRDR